MTVDLLDGLTQAGFDAQVLTCLEGEPDAAAVQHAVSGARTFGADVVVGIGGGSALDTAKLVARALADDVEVAALSGVLGRVPSFPPLALVPTTVGTGSEATAVAMYTVDGRKVAVVSPQFVPEVVALDPALLAQLPRTVVAATALDALAHGVESWQSTRSNELSRTFAARAVALIFRRLRPAYGGDIAALADLQQASFLAGMALNAGVVLGHSLSYAIAEQHPMPHGVGCAIALPYCLSYNQDAAVPELDRLVNAALGRSGTVRELAEAVQVLAADVGLPNDLRSFDLTPYQVDAIARRVVAAYPRPNNPVPLEIGRLTQLVEHLRTGDLASSWTAMGGAA